MELNKVEALIKLFETSSLGSLEITEGEFSVVMKRNGYSAPVSTDVSVQNVKPDSASAENESAFHQVKSPLAGVYYDAPSPGSAPFVKIGDRVKKGDTLCVIEAMKVMNELTSDADGEIAEIKAENGQIVEYSQVLYTIK